MNWYYVLDGKSQGPIETEVIKQMIHDGKLDGNTLAVGEHTTAGWAPIQQIPILASALPQKPHNETDSIEFHKKIEDLHRKQKRQRMLGLVTTLAVLAGIGIGIYAFVQYRIREPWRLRGITAESPTGTFDLIDQYLTQTLLMDKKDVTSHPEIKKTATTMVTYSNPKAERGQHVSAAGSITILAEKGKVTGICVSFTSSGPRGGAFYDQSTCGIWGKETYSLFVKDYPPFRQLATLWPAGTWEQTGLTDELARKGALAVFDNENAHGCWYEYGLHNLSSVIFIEAK